MNSFFVFFRKEWMELVRTKKLMLLMCVFAFLGILSPMAARYMAEIVSLAAGDVLSLSLPETTWRDSWAQYYNNLSQMGGICVIFLSMGCVIGEKRGGSAALALTKNLSHTVFITAKFTAAAVSFLISLFPSALLCYGYTCFLYGYAGEPAAILVSLAAYIIFTFALLGITVLASTAAQNTAISAVLSFCGFIALGISSYFPVIGRVLPGKLLSETVGMASGIRPSGILGAFAVSLCIAAFCLLCSVHILRRQEI